MLTIEVDFLRGRYVATDRGDREAAEWPPHPGRLFAAMVAAWGERECDSQERQALAWVEGLGPPELHLPPHFERVTVTTFVPVNDSNEQMKKGKLFQPAAQGIELTRGRQGRTFPGVSLAEDRRSVFFIWPGADKGGLAAHREALGRLLANVTYVGHSSSLARAALHDGPIAVTHRPAAAGEAGDMVLRVPGPGRLAGLEQAYHLSLAVGRRIEPAQGTFRPYVKVSPREGPEPCSVFDRMIIFQRESGPTLPLRAVLKVTTLVRRALMDLAKNSIPEELSGHAGDNSPSQRPHLAVVPLAFVGHQYADGNMRGFAVVLPRTFEGEARRKTLAALGSLQQLNFGAAGTWKLQRLTTDIPLETLRPGRYVGPKREWATVTPIVFGRFPRRLDSDEAKRMVAEHCQMIGLPEPACVEIGEVSPVLGVPPSPHFPTLSTAGKVIDLGPNKGRFRQPAPRGEQRPRLRAHARILFDRPVRGPIILGAGRYLGMGLCRWTDERR